MADVRMDIDFDKAVNPDDILRRLNNACVFLEGEVKRTLSKPGTGRVYYKGRVKHRASSPGEPPAVDTGRLRSSITHRVERDGKNFSGLVGTNVEYAKDLEMGTAKMAPRPFLRPTLENNKQRILDEFIGGGK